MNKDFQDRQEEFISLVKPKAPSEPNFTDTNDEPLDTAVMNNMLNNMVALRERELNQVQPPPQETKISQNSSQNSETNEQKKVSFDTDFISRLKKVKKPEDNDNEKKFDRESDIINELKTCIANQEKISIQLNSIMTLLRQ